MSSSVPTFVDSTDCTSSRGKVTDEPSTLKKWISIRIIIRCNCQWTQCNEKSNLGKIVGIDPSFNVVRLPILLISLGWKCKAHTGYVFTLWSNNWWRLICAIHFERIGSFRGTLQWIKTIENIVIYIYYNYQNIYTWQLYIKIGKWNWNLLWIF